MYELVVIVDQLSSLFIQMHKTLDVSVIVLDAFVIILSTMNIVIGSISTLFGQNILLGQFNSLLGHMYRTSCVNIIRYWIQSNILLCMFVIFCV